MSSPWIRAFKDLQFLQFGSDDGLDDWDDGREDDWESDQDQNEDSDDEGNQTASRDKAKLQARERLQAEKQSADHNNVYPRKIEDVGKDINNKTLLEIGKPYDRETICVRIHEYAEFRQSPCKWAKREASRIESQCPNMLPDPEDPTGIRQIQCRYCHVATFDTESNSMVMRKFQEHTCKGGMPSQKSTCYQAKVLARIPELLALVKRNRHPSAAEIREILRPYVRKELGSSMITDIREALQVNVYGAEQEELPKLGRFLPDKVHQRFPGRARMTGQRKLEPAGVFQ